MYLQFCYNYTKGCDRGYNKTPVRKINGTPSYLSISTFLVIADHGTTASVSAALSLMNSLLQWCKYELLTRIVNIEFCSGKISRLYLNFKNTKNFEITALCQGDAKKSKHFPWSDNKDKNKLKNKPTLFITYYLCTAVTDLKKFNPDMSTQYWKASVHLATVVQLLYLFPNIRRHLFKPASCLLCRFFNIKYTLRILTFWIARESNKKVKVKSKYLACQN